MRKVRATSRKGPGKGKRELPHPGEVTSTGRAVLDAGLGFLVQVGDEGRAAHRTGVKLLGFGLGVVHRASEAGQDASAPGSQGQHRAATRRTLRGPRD